jgi:serine/threonine protein kinase
MVWMPLIVSVSPLLQEIGHGEFGSVKIGQLRQLYDNILPQVEDVAIKQPKSSHNTAEDLRQLLSELKVMIAIGAHVNIVRLIGAVTKRIPQGELYIVMELCERFSLLGVLKQMSCSMETYGEKDFSPESSQNYDCLGTKNGYQPFVSSNGSVQEMVTDLMFFAYQIANGMIFISSKNVSVVPNVTYR